MSEKNIVEKQMMNPGGIIWVTYPKITSKLAGEFHRDSINAFAQTLGMSGAAMVSIDQDWSALCLKIKG